MVAVCGRVSRIGGGRSDDRQDWGSWNLHQQVAEFTTSVVYDRLGTGWSDPVLLPRTGTQVTGGTAARRRRARARGPGRAFAGPYLPEKEARRLEELNPADLFPADRIDAMRELYRKVFGRAFADWPAWLRDALLDRN